MCLQNIQMFSQTFGEKPHGMHNSIRWGNVFIIWIRKLYYSKNITRGAHAHKFRALEKKLYIFQSEHCLEYSGPVFASSFFIHGQERHRNLIIAGQTVKAALMKRCFKSPGLKRMYRVRKPPVFSAGQKSPHWFSVLCKCLGLPIYYKNNSHTFYHKPNQN